ncbi:hypothetical protein LXL04_020059 [Taraxacum kok-saghyz]
MGLLEAAVSSSCEAGSGHQEHTNPSRNRFSIPPSSRFRQPPPPIRSCDTSCDRKATNINALLRRPYPRGETSQPEQPLYSLFSVSATCCGRNKQTTDTIFCLARCCCRRKNDHTCAISFLFIAVAGGRKEQQLQLRFPADTLHPSPFSLRARPSHYNSPTIAS